MPRYKITVFNEEKMRSFAEIVDLPSFPIFTTSHHMLSDGCTGLVIKAEMLFAAAKDDILDTTDIPNAL